MDKAGKLSFAEKQKVIDNLTARQKRPALACELCGTDQWFIADHLIHTTVVVPGMAMTLGGATYPLVQILCANCGHTRLLNAYGIGLLDPTKPLTADENVSG